MKIASAILLGCLAIPGSAFSTEPGSPDEIRAGIAGAVERYANSISCPIGKVQPGDVHLLDAGRIDSHLPKYAVLWNGDIGCFGGSGSARTHVTIATVNTGQYVVQPQFSSPVVRFETPVRFVTRVISAVGDIMVLEGNAYGAGDPTANPTVPVRFTLRMEENGDWMLVEKKVISSESAGGK